MKNLVVWFQRNEHRAFAHINGEQVIWKSQRKGATEFEDFEVGRFMEKFVNHRSLLSTVEV